MKSGTLISTSTASDSIPIRHCAFVFSNSQIWKSKVLLRRNLFRKFKVCHTQIMFIFTFHYLLLTIFSASVKWRAKILSMSSISDIFDSVMSVILFTLRLVFSAYAQIALTCSCRKLSFSTGSWFLYWNSHGCVNDELDNSQFRIWPTVEVVDELGSHKTKCDGILREIVFYFLRRRAI